MPGLSEETALGEVEWRVYGHFSINLKPSPSKKKKKEKKKKFKEAKRPYREITIQKNESLIKNFSYIGHTM